MPVYRCPGLKGERTVFFGLSLYLLPFFVYVRLKLDPGDTARILRFVRAMAASRWTPLDEQQPRPRKFLNNSYVCPFIVTKIIAKIAYFSQMTLRDIILPKYYQHTQYVVVLP